MFDLGVSYQAFRKRRMVKVEPYYISKIMVIPILHGVIADSAFVAAKTYRSPSKAIRSVIEIDIGYWRISKSGCPDTTARA